MGLHKDVVNLVETDDLFAVSDCLEHGGDTEVACSAQDAFGGADDEVNGIVAEGVMSQLDDIELSIDEVFHVVGIHSGDFYGIGDAALEVLVDDEMQFLHELWLCEEDKVVVFREVFEKEPEFSQAVHVHEVGVVNDGDEHFAFMVDLPAGLDEEFFAFGVAAVGFYFEGSAEDVEGVCVGVERSSDGRSDHAFWVMIDDGLLDDAFAGAWFAHDNAEATLLGMNLDGLEDFLLVWQERWFLLIEGILFYAEV